MMATAISLFLAPYGGGNKKLKCQERVYDTFGHFKALRAEYEEKLFKEGNLALENTPSEKEC